MTDQTSSSMKGGGRGGTRHDISDDELAVLLPFFLSGRISDDDRDRVITGLNARPNAGELIAHAEAERAVISTAHEQIAVPDDALGRLLNAADETPQETVARMPVAETAQAAGGWLGRLLAFGASRPALAWAAAACLLLTTLVQTSFLITSDAPRGPSLASGERSDCATGVCVLVRFKPEATVSGVRSALSDADGRLIGERRGFLVIRFAKDAANAGTAKLQARDDIVERVLKLGGNGQ